MYQECRNSQSSHDVTGLLIAWNNGDQSALDQLAPMVHAELHRLARRYMGGERAGHLLEPTALVNEAYIRLIGWKNVEWKNRAHFFGVSAKLMRDVLVDFARRRPRVEGRTAPHVSLDEAFEVGDKSSDDLVSLDDALTALARIDERKSRIVEMRFFGGLSNEEIAGALQISTVTVIREWNKAKAWLYRELRSRP
jgi:RNA polymerase sigma factor (TIGR02999 family)